MLDHYGYPSLERYPNTFFLDQIAHLEQALAESAFSPISNRSKVVTANFEETLQGRLSLWMKGHSQWKTYREMAEYMGKNHKQIRKYVNELEIKGFFCERRTNKNVMEVRII